MRARPPMYSRPNKPLFVPVPQRDWRERTITAEALTAPAVVDAATECHVTPPEVAARMADYLGEVRDVDVLEPSAGTGNLARAVLENGCNPVRLTMIEMHSRLVEGLRSIGPVECADFLEWATDARGSRVFGAIIMNPPFRKVGAHITAARSVLASGGTLIALVPITFDGSGFDVLETLPADTFSTAKVHTKVVRLNVP